ncbi:MAG: hypothetical protein ACP5XB_23020 [Isosphaeraceae bacterium]
MLPRGDQAVYRFAWWLGPAVIAGGILAEPVGWYLRKVNRKWGFVLMVMGPVLLVAVAPAMYSDRVAVDKEHFEAKYGLWFRPTEKSVRFDDLREIRLVGVKGNRGRINYELRCFTKTGETRIVPAGDLLKNTVPEILERAKAKGVNVAIEEP